MEMFVMLVILSLLAFPCLGWLKDKVSAKVAADVTAADAQVRMATALEEMAYGVKAERPARAQR